MATITTKDGGRKMTESEKKDIAENFVRALNNRDAALMTSLTTEDIVWRIPGTSLMSGEARGVDAILKRSETLNRFGVSIKIEHVVYGLDDVGLHQHETGKHYGKVLDEHISTVCHLRGRKIHRLDTFISDVNMVNDFYVEPNTKGDDSMATITESEKKGIAENYIKALANRDAALMTSITTEDIVWSIAGTSLVSGEARGVDAILKRSETLNRFGVSIKIEHVVYGLDDVALQHRNTGKHDGKVLDEHITTVCHLHGRKIHRLDTLLSDVNKVNEYFV